MTITAADIKIGMCIEMDGKTFLVVDFQHRKPGKGLPSSVRNSKTWKRPRAGNTFSSVSQKIEQVRVELSLSVHLRGRPGRSFHAHRDLREISIDRNLINNYDLITDGQIVGDVPHREGGRSFGRASSIVDMEVICHRAGHQGDTADQLAETRDGEFRDGEGRRHDPRAAVHQHGR